MKKWIGKRVHGDSAYIATLLCIFAVVVIYMTLQYRYMSIVYVNKVERVHRKYLLEMEKEGYLSADARASLVTDLTELGCVNIDLAGTSTSPVGYGSKVVIRICCDVPLKAITVNNQGDAEAGIELWRYDDEKTGTALY